MSSCNFSCCPIPESDPPVGEGRDRQWWLIAAYLLDIVLLFIFAFFFRLHLLRPKRRRPGNGSSGSASSDEMRIASALIPALQIGGKGEKASMVN